MKYGIKNTVAVEGVSVPRSIGELTKKRTTTAFVDGDRGGELILKELLQIGDIDYITRAPKGKEVEDLEKDEVLIALRDKVPTEQFLANHEDIIPNNENRQNNKHHHKKERQNNNIKKEEKEPSIEDDEIILMKDMLKEFEETETAAFLDKALNITKEVAVENLYNELKNSDEKIDLIIFDGVVSQRLVDICAAKNINKIVAFKAANIVKKPSDIQIITMD